MTVECDFKVGSKVRGLAPYYADVEGVVMRVDGRLVEVKMADHSWIILDQDRLTLVEPAPVVSVAIPADEDA